MTSDGMAMAMSVVWCVIAGLIFIIARKIKAQKRLHQMAYGFSIVAVFMGASFLFDRIAIAQIGTTLALVCVILVLIDVIRGEQ